MANALPTLQNLRKAVATATAGSEQADPINRRFAALAVKRVTEGSEQVSRWEENIANLGSSKVQGQPDLINTVQTKIETGIKLAAQQAVLKAISPRLGITVTSNDTLALVNAIVSGKVASSEDLNQRIEQLKHSSAPPPAAETPKPVDPVPAAVA